MILAAEAEKDAKTQKQQDLTNTLAVLKMQQEAEQFAQTNALGYLKQGYAPSATLNTIDPLKAQRYVSKLPAGQVIQGTPQGFMRKDPNFLQDVFVAGDEGLSRIGRVKKGSKVITPSAMMTPEEKARSTTQGKMGEVPVGETGRYTLSREAIKSIGSARSTLFPKGTTASFRRGTLQKAALASKGVAVNDRDAQNLSRWLTTAISARQLIQTGVAARPEETQMLVQQFLGNALTNPESMMTGLKQLEDFYKDYNNTLKTKGLDGEKEISTKSVFKGVSKSGKPYERYEDGSIKWL